MEFRQLQTFVAITQTGSFSKAAERLGYSQSAVTVQIRLLENEMNVRLFDRMGKKVSLTPSGKRFLEYANGILYEMRRAKDLVKGEEMLSGPLCIGTLESLCFSKLPALLRLFRKRHPQVPVKVTVSSPKELIEMMETNQLDVIDILDRKRHRETWNKALETPEAIVFVASPACGLGGRGTLRLRDLLEEPFFLTEKHENYRRELDCRLEAEGRALTPFLEISSTEFIIRMLRENRGVSYLPLFSVQTSIDAGELELLDVEDCRMTMYRQVIYHKSKWMTKEMEEFLRVIEECS